MITFGRLLLIGSNVVVKSSLLRRRRLRVTSAWTCCDVWRPLAANETV
jgi:hypothetical protein